MKKVIILTTVFIIFYANNSNAQVVSKNSFPDSAIIYIGQINNIYFNGDLYKIFSIQKTNNSAIKFSTGLIQISPYQKGIFSFNFKTNKGYKKIVFISKVKENK